MNIKTNIIMKVYKFKEKIPCQVFEFEEGLIFPDTLDKDWYAITLIIDGVCIKQNRETKYYN